ncbi:hypothetical protein [Mucilaginibacter sp. 5C4]|uniref:hypothetical protein n=1 Tax=Mucilaginibacter sp. 5C4 TaxID=3048589 RepID=UPI002AC9BFF3|nr:hypothetical protein [Mucilaginibacter sp. 5C4]WPX25308.1 hypothetical protein RHM67_08540 [Mucilaginibacter sp. 5C4]
MGEIKRDIDVFALFEEEAKAVECKGYNYPIDQEYIKRYLTEIIPATRKWMLDKFPEKKHSFEIWSTGGFTKEALSELQAAKDKTKKYQIDFLDKEGILSKAKNLKTNKFYEVLKDYYFKDIA